MAETIAMEAIAPSTAKLAERYEILAELGRGGMGIVYKARDRETGELVALKVLRPEIASDAQILERFKNELRLAHKITHRHVARLNEFHRAGDTVYLSMEFVEGENLRALLQRSPKLDPAQALEIARQIGAGLGEAHRQSIAHRDLKPENIMVMESGDVKVMDFGISRSFAAGVTTTGAIIGTPAYMAPEQAEGRPTDHRTDIYAFGLILYEMFTGVVAFAGETPISVAMKQVRDMPKPPRDVMPGLPEHISRTILKCIAKDPVQRFQSVDEVLQSLEGALATASKPIRNLKKFWLPGIAAAAVIGAVAGIFWWRARPSDSFRIPTERFTLPNGLPVVLSVDHAAPSFTLTVEYKAGVRYEPADKSGMALLMAHLMYQGSANVAPDEHLSLIKSTGGTNNYGVGLDFAEFSSNLPANQLDLALFLEADRMRGIEITPEGLEAARSLALQQHAGQLNTPYGRVSTRLLSLLFANPVNQRVLPYSNVGELSQITAQDAAKFHSDYYVPSNAAIALVGDFDATIARERVKHYFGDVPKRQSAPAPDMREPDTPLDKREVVSDPIARVPLLILAWRAPAMGHPDWFPLQTLAEVLGANEASRLPASLVKGAGVASSVSANIENSSGPNFFTVILTAVPGKDQAQIEALCNREIERIANEGVPDKELERVRMSAIRSRGLNLVSTLVRSVMLARLEASIGNPEAVNQWEDGEQHLSSDVLRRVAKRYLTPANRVVLTGMPGGAQ
jgi:predicted Zn-dependent peptidase